jgi:hypothetical protein
MKRGVIGSVAVLLAVALAVWWWQGRSSGPDVAPPAVPVPSETQKVLVATPATDTASTAPIAAAPRPAPAEPAPLPPHLKQARSLSQVLDELVGRAESGDPAAMLELGQRLSYCDSNGLRRERRQLQYDQKSLSGEAVEEADYSAAAKANVERRMEAVQRQIDECEALPENLRSSGFEWMEKAAASGWGKAQLQYVEFALGNMRGLDEHQAIAQIEEFQRRRELARRFLADAMTHCVPDALRVQTFASDLLFDGSNTRDYAINRAAAADAAVREGIASGAEAAYIQSQQGGFDYFMAGLDEVARAEARRRGEAMFNTCAPR